MSKVKLTLRDKELIFCLNRIEQYFIELGEKVMCRKITKKKANRLFEKLEQWEEIINNIYGKE